MNEPNHQPPDGIQIWIDQGVVIFKTIERHNDPVEMNEHETEQLIKSLRECIEMIEQEDG